MKDSSLEHFTGRSTEFLGRDTFDETMLNRALADQKVRSIIQNMEERKGEPTLTGVVLHEGVWRFTVDELSKESPVGQPKTSMEFPKPPVGGMYGRGYTLSEVLSTLQLSTSHRARVHHPNETIETSQVKPIPAARYLSLAERKELDSTTSSWVLPPWAEPNPDSRLCFIDGVYYGEKGKVHHLKPNGQSVLWTPGEESILDCELHEPIEGYIDQEAAETRGVRYNFWFSVEPS